MLRKMKSRAKLLLSVFQLKATRGSMEGYLDLILGAAGGLYKPLQIRSEILGMLEVVSKNRPHRVMEIGTANGGTLFLLARAAADDAQLISLDLPYGEFGGGYSPIRIPLYRQFARGRQRVDLVRGDSHRQENRDRVERLLGGAKLDFLFIDGDHTYEGVKRDFELYSPMVRSGGLIGMHDIATHPASHNCHVDLFWNELKQKYRTTEIIENEAQGWAGIGLVHMP